MQNYGGEPRTRIGFHAVSAWAGAEHDTGAIEMDDLVERLSKGNYPVEIILRPEKTAAAFKDCIERGVVHVRFAGTRVGTELGVHLDRELTDLGSADFENKKGRARVIGTLTLNYVKVQCIAQVELETLAGTGCLIPISK